MTRRSGTAGPGVGSTPAVALVALTVLAVMPVVALSGTVVAVSQESGDTGDLPSPTSSTGGQVTPAQATQITGCGTIATPGRYEVGGDIVNASPDGACLYINSSDVILDGGGHRIDAQAGKGPDGIVVSRVDSSLRNVTIRDVNLTNWDSGLFAGAYDSGIPDGATDIHLQNVTAVANEHGIDLRAVRNATIVSSTVRGNDFDGIQFFDETNDLTSGNSTLVDNRIHNNGGHGIFVGGDNYTIRNNTVTGQAEHGIRTDGDDNRVLGNRIDGSDSTGITVKSSSERSNNTVVDNRVTGNDEGIRTDGNDHHIANNTVQANAGGGIRVGTFGDVDADYNSTVVDNTLVDNGHGIAFHPDDTMNFTVRNNTVRTNDGTGIKAHGDNHTVVDNTVVGNGGTAGIALFGFGSVARNNDVRGNDVGINVPLGSVTQPSRNTTIRDNHIKFNDGHGIDLEGNNHTITDNRVSTNGGHGVQLQNSPNNTISDNRLIRNSWTGVQLRASNDNTLRNNTVRLNGNWAVQLRDASRSNAVSETHLASATTVSFTGGDISLTSGLARPNDPDGMRELGAYLNVSTTDSDGASVVLDIHYTDSQVASLNESDLRALRWTGARWVPIAEQNTVDTAENVVTTNVTGVTAEESTHVTIFDRVPAAESGLFIDSVSPRLVRSPDSFTLTASGGGFENATVRLESPSGQNASPTTVTRSNTSLDASFSLSNPHVGVWQLVVTSPTGENATSPVFVPAAEPLVEVRDSWPNAALPGRETSARIDIHNRGIAEGRAIIGVDMANETSVHDITNLDSADRVLVNESDLVILAKHLAAGESTHVEVRYSLDPDRVQFPGQDPSENRTIELGEEFMSGLVGLVGTLNSSEWQAVQAEEPSNISVEAMDRATARHGRIGRELNRTSASALTTFMRATGEEDSAGGAYLSTLLERMTSSAWSVEMSLVDDSTTGVGGDTDSETLQALQQEPPVSPNPDGTLPTATDGIKQVAQHVCRGGPVPDELVTGAFKTKVGAEAGQKLAYAGLRYGGKRYAGTFSTLALNAGRLGTAANWVGWGLLAFEVGWKTGKEGERLINEYFEAITPVGQEPPTWGKAGGEGVRETYPWLIDGIQSGQDAASDAKRWVVSWFSEDGQKECTQQQTQASFDPNDISVTPATSPRTARWSTASGSRTSKTPPRPPGTCG